MHYKKDGSLDMRYSSSRAAVSSGSYRSSPQPVAQSRPSYQSSPASSGLNYKKDGTLDMRYSSSRSAVAAAAYAPPPAPVRAPPTPVYAPPPPPVASGDLHYKKDGSLDMRYSSSRAAVASSTSQISGTKATATPTQSQLHLKKDGSLDMRYSSSKTIAAAAVSGRATEGGLHYKKDGTLDMRYTSSKVAAVQRGMEAVRVDHEGGSGEGADALHSAREVYYQNLAAENDAYRQLVEHLAQQPVPCQATEVLPSSHQVAAYLKEYDLSTCEPAPSVVAMTLPADASSVLSADATRMEMVTRALPSDISQLSKVEVEGIITAHEELGKGAFGMVYKGRWNEKDVAVKVLYLSQLQRNEKGAFEKELIILGHLGRHANLVQLIGYSIELPCFLMELVALGSLHHNLYFNNDETVTATLGASGTKKKILVGVLSGLKQLHHVGIVHGDLKPHNVLLTAEFAAKITDFGLSRLRAKASSLTGSAMEDTSTSAPIIAGTSAYMAPELLDGNVEASTATDMYSMGILFNELCVEEDPYSEQYRRFLGKGPYAATLFAKEGNRPRLTPASRGGAGAVVCNDLIQRCWHVQPPLRPSAAALLELVLADSCVLPSLT